MIIKLAGKIIQINHLFQPDDLSIIDHGYRPPIVNLHIFMCMDSL